MLSAREQHSWRTAPASWLLPSVAGFAVWFATLSILLWNPIGFGVLLLQAALPIGVFALLFLLAKLRSLKSLTGVSALVAVIVSTAVALHDPDAIRDRARWLLLGFYYKSTLFQSGPDGLGELQHAEWDGWGFAGAGDTTVYVVFDPADSLIGVRDHADQKAQGLPCPVWKVRRLEKRWYSVTFYTDTSWESCGMASTNASLAPVRGSATPSTPQDQP